MKGVNVNYGRKLNVNVHVCKKHNRCVTSSLYTSLSLITKQAIVRSLFLLKSDACNRGYAPPSDVLHAMGCALGIVLKSM